MFNRVGLRKILPWAGAGLLSVSLASFGAAAAGPTLDDLVQEALARSPSLAALTARAAAAREAAAAADARPGLMTEVEFSDVGFPKYTVGSEEMSMVGVGVKQSLPRQAKLHARRRAAEGETQVREAEIETLRRGLVRDIRVLYARLYAVDQESSSLGPAREMLDLLAATTASRYGAGQTEQEAVIKTQLMILRVGEREADLQAERRRIVAALGRIVDRPLEMAPVAGLPPVDYPPPPWDDLVSAASPDVAERRAAIELAQRRLDDAKVELKPDYSASAFAAARGAFDPLVTLTVGVEWAGGGRARQQARVAAAARELDEARFELGAAEASARASARTLLANKEQSDAQIQRYREGLLPMSSSALDAARVAYLNGRGDFSTVIEDFNDWLSARAELARRESDQFGAWAELEALVAPAPPAAPGDKP